MYSEATGNIFDGVYRTKNKKDNNSGAGSSTFRDAVVAQPRVERSLMSFLLA